LVTSTDACNAVAHLALPTAWSHGPLKVCVLSWNQGRSSYVSPCRHCFAFLSGHSSRKSSRHWTCSPQNHYIFLACQCCNTAINARATHLFMLAMFSAHIPFISHISGIAGVRPIKLIYVSLNKNYTHQLLYNESILLDWTGFGHPGGGSEIWGSLEFFWGHWRTTYSYQCVSGTSSPIDWIPCWVMGVQWVHGHSLAWKPSQRTRDGGLCKCVSKLVSALSLLRKMFSQPLN